MGSDMFLCFDQWKQPDDILEECGAGRFLTRGNKGEKTAVAESKAKLEQRGAKIRLVENDIVDISSTQLRRMLAFHCAGPFLSPGVAAYIREHGLYDVNAQWKNLPMAELEQVVIRLLDPNRVAHVLGCRDTAVALAKRWGADVTDAARAGILHDITKALDGPLQLTVCAEYGKILGEFSRKYPRNPPRPHRFHGGGADFRGKSGGGFRHPQPHHGKSGHESAGNHHLCGRLYGAEPELSRRGNSFGSWRFPT